MLSVDELLPLFLSVQTYMTILKDYEEPAVSDQARHSVHSINYYQVSALSWAAQCYFKLHSPIKEIYL